MDGNLCECILLNSIDHRDLKEKICVNGGLSCHVVLCNVMLCYGHIMVHYVTFYKIR